jgi:hypothetical protein
MFIPRSLAIMYINHKIAKEPISTSVSISILLLVLWQM